MDTARIVERNEAAKARLEDTARTAHIRLQQEAEEQKKAQRESRFQAIPEPPSPPEREPKARAPQVRSRPSTAREGQPLTEDQGGEPL